MASVFKCHSDCPHSFTSQRGLTQHWSTCRIYGLVQAGWIAWASMTFLLTKEPLHKCVRLGTDELQVRVVNSSWAYHSLTWRFQGVEQQNSLGGSSIGTLVGSEVSLWLLLNYHQTAQSISFRALQVNLCFPISQRHRLLCDPFPVPSLHLRNPPPMPPLLQALSSPFLHIINDCLPSIKTCCLSLHCLQSTHSPPLPVPSYHMSFYTYSIHFGLISTSLVSCVHIAIACHTIQIHSLMWMSCLNSASQLFLIWQRAVVATTPCCGCGQTCLSGVSWHERRQVAITSRTQKWCGWCMTFFKLQTSTYKTYCHLTHPGTYLR